MQTGVVENYEALSKSAAEAVIAELHSNPQTVLALPTGSTPLGAYKLLADACIAGRADFSGARVFALDEYAGLSAEHPQGYAFFLQKNLLSKINIKKENTFLLNGTAGDLGGECKAHENKIASCGGIDLVLLGIGHNGHIAFNEPGTPFSSLTHIAELAESTIKANSRFFESAEEVPGKAMTVGLQTIMNSKRILLLASGAGKAQAIAAALEGAVSESVPASILQKHKKALAIIDKEAASKLRAL